MQGDEIEFSSDFTQNNEWIPNRPQSLAALNEVLNLNSVSFKCFVFFFIQRKKQGWNFRQDGGQGRGEDKEQITPVSIQDSEASSWYMEKAGCWNADHFSA